MDVVDDQLLDQQIKALPVGQGWVLFPHDDGQDDDGDDVKDGVHCVASQWREDGHVYCFQSHAVDWLL